MENIENMGTVDFVLLVLVVLNVIYVANTIWFIVEKRKHERLSKKVTKELEEFHQAIKDFEESVLFDINYDASEYFKDTFKDYKSFSETNPRYLFNLMNLRNYIMRKKDIDIFVYLEVFAISWARDPKKVYQDYLIIVKQHTLDLKKEILEEEGNL